MLRNLVIAAFLVTASAQAQSAIPLHDGDPLTITGKLKMAPGGRVQFVTVETKQTYTSGLPGDAGKPRHELALTGYHDYAQLYANRGKTITVSGTIMLDSASPSYRNGALLKATSITTGDGRDLLGSSLNDAAIAADVRTYRAIATLDADPSVPGQYTIDGGGPGNGKLSCSSNGGGDVVNCACAKGFHVTAATSSDGSTPEINDVAQFSFPGEPRAAKLSITCSR